LYLGAAVKGTSVSGKACPPVNCRRKTKTCPYGYQKKDGCDICKCSDPCNPIGTVTNYFCILSHNIDVYVLIRPEFAELINDVVSKRKLMEHLELSVK
jgi:hypothetical protein